jgi:hypothetical protein
MKRGRPLVGLTAVGLAALGALVGLTPAAAAVHSRSRVVAASYLGAGATPVMTVAATGQGNAAGGVSIPIKAGERQLSLRGVDATGLATEYEVTQLVDSIRGVYVEIGDVCGVTTRPLYLVSTTSPVVVFPELGTCDGAPSVPSKGWLTVSLK